MFSWFDCKKKARVQPVQPVQPIQVAPKNPILVIQTKPEETITKENSQVSENELLHVMSRKTSPESLPDKESVEVEQMTVLDFVKTFHGKKKHAI